MVLLTSVHLLIVSLSFPPQRSLTDRNAVLSVNVSCFCHALACLPNCKKWCFIKNLSKTSNQCQTKQHVVVYHSYLTDTSSGQVTGRVKTLNGTRFSTTNYNIEYYMTYPRNLGIFCVAIRSLGLAMLIDANRQLRSYIH